VRARPARKHSLWNRCHPGGPGNIPYGKRCTGQRVLQAVLRDEAAALRAGMDQHNKAHIDLFGIAMESRNSDGQMGTACELYDETMEV